MGNKTRQEQDKDAHSPHSLLNTALKIPAVQRKDFSLIADENILQREKPQILQENVRTNKLKKLWNAKSIY